MIGVTAYPTREQYLRQVGDAGAALVKAGYLRADDVAGVVRRAGEHWNTVVGTSTATAASRESR